MAGETGLSQSSVSRIWRAFGLKPHLVETWKLSADPEFIAKVRDVVGLYMSPPEHALVLAVDEKSQIQALDDRTAPCLPILPTTPARMTHDYVRHGTTRLFAAYHVGSGSVIAQSYRRHRHQEFLRFLKVIDTAVPKDLDCTWSWTTTPRTRPRPSTSGWSGIPGSTFTSRPPAQAGSTSSNGGSPSSPPASSEGSAHRSVTELEDDIRKWINEWNKNPKPFVWTKTADDILETLAVYCQQIADSGH
jgi:hypothetical protein